MRNNISQQILAGVCALGMCLTLAACGNSSNASSGDSKNSSSSSTDSKSNSSDNSSSSSGSSLKQLKQLAGVTATGELGKKPSVALASTPMTVENNAYAILQEGNGKAVESDDRVCLQAVYVNAKNGEEIGNTWDKNTPDCSLNLGDSSTGEEYKELFTGRKINTTIGFGVNDSNSAGTSYIMALTIVSTSKDYTKATGTEVTDVPSNLPKVTRAKDGKPSIDMNGYKGSKKLVAQTLVKGDGAKVTDKNTVRVKYTGWLLDGTQFDSSWDKNTTLDADTYSGGQHTVIDGWQQGMVGQTVGSQVLLVIPPDLGYGSTATGSIPANSTLVFVVDILAAY